MADAVRQEYTINRMSLDEVINPIASVARGFYRRGSQAGEEQGAPATRNNRTRHGVLKVVPSMRSSEREQWPSA